MQDMREKGQARRQYAPIFLCTSPVTLSPKTRNFLMPKADKKKVFKAISLNCPHLSSQHHPPHLASVHGPMSLQSQSCCQPLHAPHSPDTMAGTSSSSQYLLNFHQSQEKWLQGSGDHARLFRDEESEENKAV